jgi:hypothetical protein
MDRSIAVGMPLYIQYGTQSLTCVWRSDDTLVVRLRRQKNHGEGLHVRIGDTLLLLDERGRERWVCGVRSFTPHIQYGRFVRSGTVVCTYVVSSDAS